MKEISLNEYAAVLNSSDYPIVVLLFYAHHAPLFYRIQTRSRLSPRDGYDTNEQPQDKWMSYNLGDFLR